MIFIIIYHILICFCAAITTYIVGKLILCHTSFKGNFFFRLFVTYLLGILAIVFLISIFKSHFRTVHVVLIPIIGYVLYRNRKAFTKNFTWNKAETIKEIAWSILPLFIVFLYQCFFYFDFQKGIIKSLFADYYVYAFYIDSLKLWGVENQLTDLNYFFPSYRGLNMPYHYSELWFSALFSTVFKNSSLNSYYFITYPILTSTFIFGIASLFEDSIKSNLLILTVSLGLCFITDIYLEYYLKTPNSISIMAINGQKLAFVYNFILLGYILIRKNIRELGFISLLIVPIFSIAFLPGIWCGLCVIYFTTLVFSKNIKKTESIRNIILVLGTIFLFGLFTHFSKSEYTDDFAFKKIFSSGIFKGITSFNTFSSIKMLIGNFIMYGIPNVILHSFSRIILYVPFFIILARSCFKEYKLFMYSIVFVIFGALATSLTKVLNDSNQFTHVQGAVLITFIIIIVATFFEKKRTMFTTLFVLLSFVSCISFAWYSPYNSRGYSSYSVDMNYYAQISPYITKDETIIMSFFSSNVDGNSIYCWVQANDILLVNQFNRHTIINVLGNPEVYLHEKNCTYEDNYFFNHFTPLQLWRNDGKTLEQLVDRYKIKLFYCKNGSTVPDFIIRRTIKTIESPQTKDRFIICR